MTDEILYSVRNASYDEAFEILSEPQIDARIRARLHKPPVVPRFRKIVQWGKYKMLFTYTTLGGGATKVIHAHIAVPKDSILGCRVLAILACYWILHIAAPDAGLLFVDLPEGKMSNMALKLGFKRNTASGSLVYTITSTAVKELVSKYTLTLVK